MLEKDCPKCGARCARVAQACKSCGHQFTSGKRKKRAAAQPLEADRMAAGLTPEGGLIVFHIERGTFEQYTAAEAQQIKRALKLLPDVPVSADAAQT